MRHCAQGRPRERAAAKTRVLYELSPLCGLRRLQLERIVTPKSRSPNRSPCLAAPCDTDGQASVADFSVALKCLHGGTVLGADAGARAPEPAPLGVLPQRLSDL